MEEAGSEGFFTQRIQAAVNAIHGSAFQLPYWLSKSEKTVGLRIHTPFSTNDLCLSMSFKPVSAPFQVGAILEVRMGRLGVTNEKARTRCRIRACRNKLQFCRNLTSLCQTQSTCWHYLPDQTEPSERRRPSSLLRGLASDSRAGRIFQGLSPATGESHR